MHVSSLWTLHHLLHIQEKRPFLSQDYRFSPQVGVSNVVVIDVTEDVYDFQIASAELRYYDSAIPVYNAVIQRKSITIFSLSSLLCSARCQSPSRAREDQGATAPASTGIYGSASKALCGDTNR